MMIKQALFEMLEGDSDVASLTNGGENIFAEVIPQKGFDEVTKQPCVVIHRVGTDRDATRCASDDLVRSEFSVTAFAREYEEAEALATAVRGLLLDFQGTWSGMRIRDAKLANEFDSLDIDPGLYRVDQLWTIWHDAP